MASSSTINNGFSTPEASSSSSRSPPNESQHNDDRDEIDALWPEAENDDFLGDDSQRQELDEPISFKRKPKRSIFSQTSRLITTLTGRPDSRGGSVQASYGGQRAQQGPEETFLDDITSPWRRGAQSRANHGSKDGVPLDWYVEGPGRRVAYEDLTAIDWIFEYTKERTRLRVLYSSATGVFGYVQRLLDASQVWIILVLTGIAVGALAAGIDVTTDWLGDLKAGYCSTVDGGAFYLNKGFCCLGYEEWSQCAGWRPWAAALGITSVGGKWFIEYFFFLIFSVRCRKAFPRFEFVLISVTGNIGILRKHFGTGVFGLRQA